MEYKMLLWLLKGFDGLLGMLEEAADSVKITAPYAHKEAQKLKERFDRVVQKIAEKNHGAD